MCCVVIHDLDWICYKRFLQLSLGETFARDWTVAKHVRVGKRSELGSKTEDTDPKSVDTKAARRSRRHQVRRNAIVKPSCGALQRTGFLLEGCSINCGQPPKCRQTKFLKSISRSTRLLAVPFIFLVLWTNFSRIAVHRWRQYSGPMTVSTYLAHMKKFHVAKVLTVYGHPIELLMQLSLPHCAQQLPMIEVEPSHPIHHHKSRRQVGHQRPQRCVCID